MLQDLTKLRHSIEMGMILNVLIYFLKLKSKVPRVFWKFKQWIETQSNHIIQVLRSVNGEEYAFD